MTTDSARRGCPDDEGDAAASAIRSGDSAIIALLAEGCRQSPTLRRLADRIAGTDGIVYIERGRCPNPALRGCLLHRIEDTGTTRYLWIAMRVDARRADVVATIGHELQHAVEVLTQSWIRSRWDVEHYYRSFATGAFGTGRNASLFRSYETGAAISVTSAILSELAEFSTAAAAAADDDTQH